MSEDMMKKLAEYRAQVELCSKAISQSKKVKEAYLQKFLQAILDQDDKAIAKARDELVDAFSAGLDVYIEQTRILWTFLPKK